MKANELRIGNYVIDNRDDSIHKVTGSTIHSYEFSNTSILKPIPLNEEWLLKFGFEQKGSFYRIKNSRFAEIIVYDDGIDVCNHSVYLPHIKSVHQLQNLYFALTGCELEIK